ncbi:MAG: hypothetical protein IPM18_15880 [Phycisphaerales bacterium]|nr:hypothetical protein [Phycisphaerales bacterium]
MRTIVLLTTLLFGSTLATAQGVQAAPRPQRPALTQTAPTGEQLLLWVCRQLQLDDDQMAQARDLLDIYKATAEAENPLAFLEEMQRLVAQRDAANQEGDQVRAAQIQKQLQEMRPGMAAEEEFFQNLTLILSDTQLAQLPAIRERAKTVKDITLRPVHALLAVRASDLTQEQHRNVEVVLAKFRAQAPALRSDEARPNDEAVEQLIRDLRAVLTPAQVRGYDERIAALRAEVPEAQPVRLDPRPAAGADARVERGAVAPATTLQAQPESVEASPAEQPRD